MKRSVLILGVSFLFFQTAQAGWGDVFSNAGHALADVVSVGGYGRERQNEFEQKEAQLRELRHQELIQRRELEIAKLEELINFAKNTKTGSEDIKSRNADLYASLSEVNRLFKLQLAGKVRIQSRIEGAQASAQELKADFELLSVLLKHVAIPTRQRAVMNLLETVAKDRGLQVQDYIARALEQSQLNRTNLIKINELLSKVLPQIKALEQIQIDEIKKIDATIATNQDALNKLKELKNNEAAAYAAEQAKLKAEQDAAAQPEPRVRSGMAEVMHRRLAD